MDRDKEITVRQKYLDEDYRDLLRTMAKFEYSTVKSRTGISTQKYAENVVIHTIEQSFELIKVEGRDTFEPDYDQIYSNRKLFSDFLGDRYPRRRFNDNLLQIVDAFLQIAVPRFQLIISEREVTDRVGNLLGAFLRDASSVSDRYQAALIQQKLLGIYKYQEVDSHQYRIGEDRFLAMFAGKNPDYIDLLDINAKIKARDSLQRERLKTYTGFCIPGIKFSPVLMRTTCFRRRQLGLLYTPGSLIDAVGGALDEITYEVFTTDGSAFGSKFTAEKYGDSSFAKALDIHYGPKKRRQLKKLIAKTELQDAAERIEFIRRNML